VVNEFPEFMRNPINAVGSHQKSAGVAGFIYDGADGSQVLIFYCASSGISKEHVHDFDEYFVVIQGEYTLGIQGKTIKLTRGREYYIPKGLPHDGAFIAGTRTINAFGGKRAERKLGGPSS
jgi:quercetin dioxygenase-like cupin family protein